MAKIFSPPDGLTQPTLDFANFANYQKGCEDYKENLKKMLLKRNPNGKNVGEIISFPVADGTADYMVAKMQPLELVHIPLMDAWEFNYVHLLKAKDVQEKIDQQKALEKLFSKKG